MLQKLSYFNLCMAIVYMVIYLKSGTLNSTAGIFAIVVFNWLALRSYQQDDYKWKVWHYLFAIWSIYYAGFMTYGLINVVIPAFTYDFVSNDTLTFIALTTILVVGLLWQAVLYYFKNLKTQRT